MKKKILVVDDDRTLCEEIAEALRDEGYSVENTSEPQKAESFIAEKKYNIYLLDYKMPGLTGIDLLKKIKTQNPKADVFIISGKPFIENLLAQERVTALVAGVIQKPFDVEALLQSIRAVS